MTLDISTPALLFPATSLLLLAYTNRYTALARIIRELAAELREHDDDALRVQIDGLRRRLTLIKAMQAFGVAGLIGCLLSMSLLFIARPEDGVTLTLPNQLGNICFGISILLMIASLVSCLAEILMSGNALRVVLDRCSQCKSGKK